MSDMIGKHEAIERVRKEALSAIAHTIVRYPGPAGLLMAAGIEACANNNMHAIAAYVEPKPGEVVATVGPVMRADG